jgi:hypothetical protein
LLTSGSGRVGPLACGRLLLVSDCGGRLSVRHLRINGIQQMIGTSNPGTGNGGVASISGVIKLNVGDVVSIWGFQQSGSTYNTQGQGASIFLISAF